MKEKSSAAIYDYSSGFSQFANIPKQNLAYLNMPFIPQVVTNMNQYSQQPIQQPIIQNNYINNFSFFPQSNFHLSEKNDNNDITEKLKKAIQKSESKTEDLSKKTYIENFPICDMEIPTDKKILSTTLDDLNTKENDFNLFGGYNSILNSTNRDSYLSSTLEKKLSIEDGGISNIHKKIEKMSINNDNYYNDLMKDEFVDYVYNYKFSMNEKDDLQFSNINRINGININNTSSGEYKYSLNGFNPIVPIIDMKNDVETENDISKSIIDEKDYLDRNELDGNFNIDELEKDELSYNNYYNNLFNIKAS